MSERECERERVRLNCMVGEMGPSCPTIEMEPLSHNPVFTKLSPDLSSIHTSSPLGRIPLNLIAYDGSGLLFLWNSCEKLLHFVEIQQPDNLQMGFPSTLFAGKHFKTIQLDFNVDFQVRTLIINRRGRLLLLAGDDGIRVMDLPSQLSTSFRDSSTTGKCRAAAVGGKLFYSSNKMKASRILQVAWHPYSDTHIGILSSDAVFRLLDLSVDTENPEQEYHIQSMFADRTYPSSYSRPVAFAFGGEHLWDRFAVFILFSNGVIHVICPVVPFGSLFSCSAIEELHKDSHQRALEPSLAGSKLLRNASLGAAWLEAVFPSLARHSSSSIGHEEGSLVLKAHAYVPVDASVLLQGPLPVVVGGDSSSGTSTSADHSSRASMLLYNTIGKDSILAVSLRDGQMQLYALADELQPMWKEGSPPRLRVDNEGNLLSVGMLVETLAYKSVPNRIFVNSDIRKDRDLFDKIHGVWEVQPPLLQLAVIDFALQVPVLEVAPLTLLADPVVPERLYCYHAAGLDAVVLQWLPFSDQSIDRASAGKPPVVYPILDIYQGGNALPSPLLGVAEVLDSFGELWLVSVTASCECAVIEMKVHKALLPLQLEGSEVQEDNQSPEGASFEVMSKELLLGPKDIPLAKSLSSSRSFTLDSIEGRTFLHDQCEILHEKYIEYAHRVHVELTSHVVRLNNIVQEQHVRLNNSQKKLIEAFRQMGSLTDRIRESSERNKQLEMRIKKFSTLQCLRLRPLTAAEQEFKSQLDVIKLCDVDILHSTIDMLKERFERYLQLSQCQTKETSQHSSFQGKRIVPDMQLSRLKMALTQLTQIIEVATRQVRTLDEMVKKREILSDR